MAGQATWQMVGEAPQHIVARRLSDALIINAADNIMSPEAAVEAGSITSDSSHDEDAIVETYKGATMYTVTLTIIQHATADSDGQAQYAVNWYTKTDIDKLHIDTTLAACVHYVIYGEPTDIVMNRSVTVCTEYQRNDIPFRCHPNYHSHGHCMIGHCSSSKSPMNRTKHG